MRKYAPAAACVIAITILDQATKYYIRHSIPLYASVHLIDGFLSLTHLQNRGAAFSFLADVQSPWVGRGFALLSVFALGVIAYLYKQAAENATLLRVALTLIMAGAAGNLIDRLTIGTVTDFVDMFIGTHHWPAYNVADSCISIGAVLAGIWWGFFEKPAEK